MKTSMSNKNFLDAFDHLNTITANKNTLQLFVLKINANQFDHERLKEELIDPMIDFSVSRKVKDKYKDRAGTLSKKAREKFVAYLKNTGELGELLLYCFLCQGQIKNEQKRQ